MLFLAGVLSCIYLRHMLSLALTSEGERGGPAAERPLRVGGGAAGRALADPEDYFSDGDRKNGALLLHFVGLFYMFVAIAIVCDECFVPALEVIVEVLELSNDVAGATFMAAGGSAPEFFTSLIGAIFAESDIGTGTIIGSAVFNVLFVIGACAVAAQDPIKLTEFPLKRDSIFYAVDLIVIVAVFLDEKVYWWEALILFALYLVYTTFMAYSTRIESWMKGLAVDANVEEPSHDKAKEAWAAPREGQQAPQKFHGLPMPAAGTGEDQGRPEETHGDGKGMKSCLSSASVDTHSGQPKAQFRHKARRVSNSSNSFCLPSSAQSAPGSARTTLMSVAPAFSSMGSTEAPAGVLDVLENATSGPGRMQSLQTTETVGDSTGGSACHEWNSKSCDVLTGGAGSGEAAPTPPGQPPGLLFPVLPASNPPPHLDMHHEVGTTMSLEKAMLETPEDVALMAYPNLLPAMVAESSTENVDSEGPVDVAEPDLPEEENAPLSFLPPSCNAKPQDWLWYFGTLPIVFCLVCTIPDVRRDGCRKYFAGTFCGSIVWIALFTWFMVWFATVIAETFNTSEVIMGLTILAAGTSVPDLFTSMIVTRQGYGDMAVSSSIGSNIFDVTVGLPVPWMVYAAVRNGEAVKIKNEGLEISVMLLLAMLFFTIFTIMWHKWVMTRKLGASLLALYLIFEVVAVGLTFAPEGSLKLLDR